MNEKVKLWVSALRSGEFKQGRRGLRKEGFCQEDQYCCLGVACELFRRETGQGEWEIGDNGQSYMNFKLGNSFSYSFPTEPVNVWLGFDDSDISPYDLATANDNGKTFEEIADLIEQAFDPQSK